VRRYAGRWSKERGHSTAAASVEVKIDPTVDMKTPPKIQVDTMAAGKYPGLDLI
jgi:hypothetical protein